MFELTGDQKDAVSGGNPILITMAVIGFFATTYQQSVDFTSGMIEGFMDAGK